ncbi:MAG: hypothetical protein E6902_01385 [Paeniclostridium sordellii]|uniref:Uncharacterized protein n=1 Tax=Paeniclostridium hominis TaxID=2764329 RepID=A0ABR7K1Y3_9FIRM|nr:MULTISPECIES: hypothetical protein [Paeniclostridium]MBC6003032.1 hypothetical protein [Paeniclostridium hominis]MDU1538245.1 hypothetical protein [Paeniclostridium sordellii]
MKKASSVVIFLLSLTSLMLSGRLFFHYKFLADSYNMSLIKLVGGDIWLLMELVNLGILCIISIVALFKCIVAFKEKQ